MKSRVSIMTLVLPAMGLCFPPGAPMSDFGPSQVSLAAYFDHSGQDLFDDLSPSVLNSTGLSLDYGPWSFLQFGLFGGATEFDVGLPDARVADPDAFAYNSDYSFSAGGSLKLATPRFASGTTRAVAFGSVTYVKSEDVPGNSKMGLVYDAGASIQYMFLNRVNFVLGGEFFTIEGEQKAAAGGDAVAFSTSAPGGNIDYLRGLVGLEYYFKGKNRPFVSIAFRPTGNVGWHDDLGLRNASISISLGAMATLGKEAPDAGEEDAGMIDQ
ncbi:MAG TPA: hypothetical protein VJ385_19280 [Fibrobacteria bacterium]|nr:hypothetical protein [Fibrobacteria bacterium]